MSSFGGVIKLTGATQYQQSLKNIMQGLKEVSSQMKLATSQFDKNDNSTEALTKRSEVLTKKLNEQENYVNTLKKAYQELKEKGYEENSKELSDMRVEMNKAEADFNNTEREVKELNLQIQKSEDPLEKLGNAFKESGESAEHSAKEGFTVFKGMLSNLASQVVSKAISSIKSLGGSLNEWSKMSDDLKEQEAKLTQVMKNTTNASDKQIKSIIDLTAKEEKLGVVSQETQLAGLQELGTYIEHEKTLKKLLPVMNDMIAQQYGVGASMESASSIATMMGKVLGNGQVSALSKLGYKFDETQEKVLKFGTEEQKASMLAEVITQSVGGMNRALAQTEKGIEAINISKFDDLKKSAGEAFSTIKANVLSSVSKTLLPILEKATNSLKQMIASVNWEAFGNKVSRAFEKALEGIKWVIKNKNLFINAMKMVVAAFVTNKVATWGKTLIDAGSKLKSVIKISKDATAVLSANTIAQKANTTAQIAGTTATKGLNSAMLLLNHAWKTSPIGVIVAGVTAFVGVMSILKGKIAETTESQRKYNSELKKISDSINEYRYSMNEIDKTRQEYLDNSLSELDYYESLYNELKGITNANGKVKKGYEERASFIVSTLNNALGTEIKMTKNTISKYQSLEKTIRSVIEAKRAQSLVEANEDKYNKARSEKTRLERDYSDALALNVQKEQERNEIIQKMSEYLKISNDKLKEFIDENGKVDTDALREYMISAGLTDNSLTQLGWSFQKMNLQLQDTEKSIKENALIVEDAKQAYIDNEQTISNYEKALENLKTKNYDVVLSIYEDTHNFIGKTDEETYNNYQKQINMHENYLKELKNNSDKYDANFIENETKKHETVIDNLKKEQKKYLSTTKEGLDEVNKELKMKSEEAGKNAVVGLNDGISNRSLQSSVFKAATNLGNQILAKLKNSLKEKSPSKATNEMGQFLDEGIMLGIKAKSSTVLKEVSGFGKSILNQLDNELKYENKNKLSITPEVNKPDFSSISKMTKKINVPIENEQNYFVSALQKALSGMAVEMDGEKMGKIILKTVEDELYT